MSCRTGPLRVERSLRDRYTLSWQDDQHRSSRWSAVTCADQREDRVSARPKQVTKCLPEPGPTKQAFVCGVATCSGPVRQDTAKIHTCPSLPAAITTGASAPAPSLSASKPSSWASLTSRPTPSRMAASSTPPITHPKEPSNKPSRCSTKAQPSSTSAANPPAPMPRLCTTEEEQSRILPAIESILKAKPDTILSVDTFHATTARRAVEAGAEIVNDVSGHLWDPDMSATCAQLGCGAILMHTRGRPHDWPSLPPLAPHEVIPLVLTELAERLEAATCAGIPRDKIVLDPGFGFGKRLDENYPLLAHLSELQQFKPANSCRHLPQRLPCPHTRPKPQPVHPSRWSSTVHGRSSPRNHGG